MGTKLDTKMTGHVLNEFWGGSDRGVCLQVTASTPLHVCDTPEDQIQEEGFIQLTMEEAAALCNELGMFVQREAKRRQRLLKIELEQAQIKERTVMHEVAALPGDLMYGPELAVALVSRYCPKE